MKPPVVDDPDDPRGGGRSMWPNLRGDGVVTFGETMALLTPPTAARLQDGAAMRLGIGGAESNVAVALARLGHRSTWISRLGADDFGTLVARELRAEGVTVLAEHTDQAPTGLMVKEARAGRIMRVRYYRSASAMSLIVPEQVEAHREVIGRAAVLHVTGITPALGEHSAAATLRAVEIASAAGTFVSFDVNHRSALWSAQRAGPVLADLARRADLVFAGAQEAALLLGAARDSPASLDQGEQLAHELADAVGGLVVLKLGELGAVAVREGVADHGPTAAVVATDPVGAGDAFVGGFLCALIEGATMQNCLALGNRVAGEVCQVPGDWEGLPTRAHLAAADSAGNGAGDIVR